MKGNVITTFVLKFAGALFNLGIILILSNELGPEKKGLCSLGITLVSMAQIMGDLIGGPTFVFLSKKFNNKFLINATLIWNLPVNILLFFFIKEYLNYSATLSALIAFFSFFNAVFYSLNNIIIGKQKFKLAAWINFSQISIVVVSLFFSLKILPDPALYFLICLISYIVCSIIYLFVLTTDENSFETKSNGLFSIVEILRAGFQNQTSHLIQFFNFRLTYFLISPFLLGIFSNATSIGESLWLISNSFATILIGKTVNLSEDKENYLLRHFRMLVFLIIPAGILMVLIPDSFYTFIFGNDFTGIQHALIYLVPGILAMALYNIIGHYFSALGQFKYNIICALTGFLCTMFVIFFFYLKGEELSILNASIITSLSYLTNFITAIFIFYKSHQFKLIELLPGKEESKGILALIRNGFNIFGHRE